MAIVVVLDHKHTKLLKAIYTTCYCVVRKKRF